MELFLIWTIVLSLFYGIICTLFYLRSKSGLILKRSPLFVLISQLGALSQSIIILSQLLQTSEKFYIQAEKHHGLIFRFRQAGLLLAHYLIFAPYLIRCYRLHFLFSLDANWDSQDSFFSQHKYRVEQKWLLKLLIGCSTPVLLLIALIFISKPVSCFIPGSELAKTKLEHDLSECSYILLCFLEQVSLVFAGYLLRHVKDDYKVSSELWFITIAWVITPIFPFVKENDSQYVIPILIRDVCMLIRSCVYPLIMSFFTPVHFEIVTLEMISSLDLVLQSEIPLEYFEEFLVNLNTNSALEKENLLDGVALLDLYMKCENFLVGPEMWTGNEIIKDLEKNIPGHSASISPNSIYRSKKVIFEILNTEFFCQFLNSPNYQKLRRQTIKQEIYLGRIFQTSLQCKFYLATVVSRRKSAQQLARLF